MLAADLHHLEDDETCPAAAYWRMVELTRTMERERDEWRKKAVDLHARNKGALEDLETAIAERNMARLVRHARGRWLYAFSLDAEEWNGCCKNIEDAIIQAFRDAHDDELKAGTPIFFAHGYRLPKSECDEWGMEWPWYQVDPKDALTILLPNATVEATPSRNSENQNGN